MKLPSIQLLLNQSFSAFRKHPMVVLSAAFAVFFAICLLEKEAELENFFPFVNLLLCGYLGVPLFIAVDIYATSGNLAEQFRTVAYSTVILILGGVYFYLPGSEQTLNISVPYIRYVILAIAAHLLVSFAPFLNRGSLNGFWHFNKVLFLRFILSALYSAAFFLGLSLALFAVDSLFEVQINEKLYAELFFFMAGVFNTWFFVAGFPTEYDALDKDENYPRGLKTFITYVLIPLLGLYFVILYSYSVKILVQWDWPSGIMVYMILVVAILGTLTMLLAYPYDREFFGGPIRFLQKGFFWVLIPIIVMLYLAIGIRVAEYGVTINRYITIFLAVWLSGISIYMVAGGKDIRVVPMSLFAIVLLCSFGPWGVFQVSERSQVNRLETILEGQGLLVDGKIANEPVWDRTDTLGLKLVPEYVNEGFLSDSLHNEVHSIVDYLEQFHGLNAVEGWFDQNPREIARELDYSEDYVVMQLMGLRSGFKYGNNLSFEYPSFYALETNREVLDVTGFELLYELNLSITSSLDQSLDSVITKEGKQLGITLTRETLEIAYLDYQELSIDLITFYDELKSEYISEDKQLGRVPIDEMVLSAENEDLIGRLRIESLAANEDGVDTCVGKLLIGLKD